MILENDMADFYWKDTWFTGETDARHVWDVHDERTLESMYGIIYAARP